MGRFEAGRILVLIDRGDYWQCAYVIPGGIDEVRAKGLDAFRATSRGACRCLPTASQIEGLGPDQAAHGGGRSLPVWHKPGSFASATPRTRCRRLVASA